MVWPGSGSNFFLAIWDIGHKKRDLFEQRGSFYFQENSQNFSRPDPVLFPSCVCNGTDCGAGPAIHIGPDSVLHLELYKYLQPTYCKKCI
jgi:hypothetical protein